MDRPYVFCHMLTSVDGKVDGPYKNQEHVQEAMQFYDQVSFTRKGPYRMQGWLTGKGTTQEKFTHYAKPQLRHFVKVPAGDYIIHTHRAMYYIALDPRGQMGWQANYIVHHQVAYVIEVLSEQATDAYKDFLRQKHIPYIICGHQSIDYQVMLEKLKNDFGIKSLMLAGGPVLNWAFIQAGLCDELSIVIAPGADGSAISQSGFVNKQASSHPVAFDLIEAKSCGGNTVWLRYKVEKGEA